MRVLSHLRLASRVAWMRTRVRRRARRAARIAVTRAEAALAARRAAGNRPDDALRLLHDAARRSPADARVARQRAQVLARTGRLSDALVAATRLSAAAPAPAHRRLQRSLQGRWAETHPAWRPVITGTPPAGDPAPGRVLYLAKESTPYLGNGYCTRTHESLLAVRNAGRDPVAVTVPGFPAGGPPRTEVDGIEYRHVLPGARTLLEHLPFEEYGQLTATQFARHLIATRPQIVHAGSGHRGYDLGVVGRALAEWAGLPWIYEVRSFFETTWTADERYAEQAEYYHRRFEAETRAMRAADAVVTLSGPMRDEIVRERGVEGGKVFVVPNAVDLQRFTPQARDLARRARIGFEGTFTLGYVSNLDHHREGQEVLLEAAARLRAQGVPVSVLLVGEGRRRADLEKRARGLGLRCHFTGAVPFPEVPGWYAQIDLFVVPRVNERAARLVSPMKPFEAMAMGVPVLVSDLPALTEIAGARQRRASVFRAGDPASLAAAVVQLMAAPSLRAQRAAAAREWVQRERTWAAAGTAFDAVYRFAQQRHGVVDLSDRELPLPVGASTC
jgi:glycosyltransferase involved in cell wall biosynthesis